MPSTERTPRPADPDYARIKALFESVCELPEAAQADALRQAGTSEADIARVMPLLIRDRKARDQQAMSGDDSTGGHGLGRPVSHMLGSLAASDVNVGDRLGPWQIAGIVGHGGMGTVYRAERADGQFTQAAAIKVLSGLPTAETLAFLARERQILASLSHPNIARLIDGGTTPLGHPYLAMDFVDGTNIDAYCRDNRLGFRAVLALFRTVCQAVTYAHQRLTLHCDLKPSNVMIDRGGRPMLLDFGIAQLIDSARSGGSAAPATGTSTDGAAAFTPRFASPEQRAGAPLGTASDVFSLGRMLAELAPVGSASGRLRSEYAAVLARATAEEPSARYSGVGALERDLGHLLADEPVDALPLTLWYTGGKFLQRRWGMVSAGAAFVIMGSVLTLNAAQQRDRALAAELQARTDLQRALSAEDTARAERDRAQVAEQRAREGTEDAERASNAATRDRDRALRAEQQARREADRAIRAEAQAVVEGKVSREVRDFMVSLFEDMNSSVPGARKVTAYELLERGRKQLDERAVTQPQIRAELLQALAKIYDNIGDLENTRLLYRKVAEIERDPVNGRPEILARALSRVALAESNSANHAAAEAPARESLEIRRRIGGEDSLDTADSHGVLGLVLSGLRRQAESREHLEAALRIREKRLPANDESIASALHNLGQHYAMTGDFDKSVPLYERAIAIKAGLFGEKHPKTFNSVEGLGMTLWRANRLSQAEPILARLHAGQLELNGPQSERLASAADAWGNVLFDLGHLADARKRFEEAAAILGAPPLEQRSLRYAIYANNLALACEEAGDLDAAEKSSRASLAVRRRHVAADSPMLARAQNALARIQLKRGQLAEARTLMQEALALREKKLAADDPEVFDSKLSLVELNLADGRVADAAKLLEALPVPAKGGNGRRIGRLRVAAGVQAAQGNWAAARELSNERLTLATSFNGASHPRTTGAMMDHARLLARAGDAAAARELARQIQPRAAVFAPGAAIHAELAALLATPPTPH